MSAPRQILPGSSYLITRRCSERRFFLRPSPLVNSFILYSLALTSSRYSIQLHAFAFLSNHYHIVLSDPLGLLPLFLHDFDLLLARALNSLYARFENFWAPGSYSAVLLADHNAIIDAISYTLANPVSAGLVPRASLWPGVISSILDIGAPPRLVPRPTLFFRPSPSDSPHPPIPLHISPPPPFHSMPLPHLRHLLALRLAQRENLARSQRRGRPFLGINRVLSSPISASPQDHEPRFHLNPRVAARSPHSRSLALSRLRAFLLAYRRAWLKLKAGAHRVLFPPGTWKLRRELGVLCEAPS